MSQSGRGQIETALTIGECTDYPGAAADLPHDPLKGVVGPNFLPVFVWKSIVCQGLTDVLLDQFSGTGEPLTPESLNNVARFVLSRLQVLLRVDGLEHMGHLADLR